MRRRWCLSRAADAHDASPPLGLSRDADAHDASQLGLAGLLMLMMRPSCA